MSKALSYLVIAAILSTCGNIVLKLSRSSSLNGLPDWIANLHSSMLFLFAGGFYFLNLLAFSKALEVLPVSVGYPLLASLGFVFLTISSAIFLYESISNTQVLGIAIILFGIFLLASGESN